MIFNLPENLYLAREHFKNPWFKAKVAKEKLIDKKTKALIEVPIALARMGDVMVEKLTPVSTNSPSEDDKKN